MELPDRRADPRLASLESERVRRIRPCVSRRTSRTSRASHAAFFLSFVLHATVVAAGVIFGPQLVGHPEPRPITAAEWRPTEVTQEIEEQTEPLAPIEERLPEPVELEDAPVPVLPERLLAFDLEPLERELVPVERLPQPWFEHLLPPKTAPAEPVAAKTPEPEAAAPPPQAEPQPLAGHNPAPTYPARAVRLELEGTVILLVEVDDDGNVVSVEVTESSGAKLLDREALRTVRTWRFDRGPGKTQVEIVFQLRSRR